MSSFFKCNELIMPVICVFFQCVPGLYNLKVEWCQGMYMESFVVFFWVRLFFFLINLFDLEANYSTILWWFCHTLTWISHGCTGVPILNPLPPLSPPYPSGSSQYTSPEHPVSCIKPGLLIYFTYGNIHVSKLFSQIIPPSPSPTESKSLFFTSVSLLLSRI